jgi:hypothetical protein
MSKVVVQPSPIHGRGVFAARRFERNEVIIDGCREVLSHEAIGSLPPEEKAFLSVERVPGLMLECNCKAPTCRGLLVVPSARE